MRTAALITAAGKSSRMGDFKPMLQMGTISIAQRVIHNFRQAGISKIVMVTGYNSEILEHHLASNNIVFLRNEQYASTQMFDSVKIGLDYLKDKADTVLFSPVDVPLFTAETVTKMLDLNQLLVTPCFQGRPGHPILIRSELIESILVWVSKVD
ncbi:MAG: nucleotidyltransferase family protein [Lachnospiraceae bacterium]|nr:nucleotidyltransferase family protein [Lachnospiraceae bacterium]